MTNEEAIMLLEETKGWHLKKVCEALDMAIEALKDVQNCVHCEHYTEVETDTGIHGECKMDTAHKGDLISRQDVYCVLEKKMVDRPLDSDRWVIRDIDKAIKSLPSADPKTGENANANEIYNYLKERIGDIVDDMKEFDAWFERMVWHVKECNRLAAEPKTDGVLEQVRWERDCALKTLEDHGIGFGQEPKTGKWLEVEVLPEVYDIEGVKTWGSKMQCDQCGFRFTAIEGHITQYNFCPNCRARMTSGKG